MKVACGDEYYTSVAYDPKKEVLCIDRSHSGYLFDILHRREIQVPPLNGAVTLRCVMDRFSLEIFINGRKPDGDGNIFYAPGSRRDHLRGEGESNHRY